MPSNPSRLPRELSLLLGLVIFRGMPSLFHLLTLAWLPWRETSRLPKLIPPTCTEIHPAVALSEGSEDQTPTTQKMQSPEPKAFIRARGVRGGEEGGRGSLTLFMSPFPPLTITLGPAQPRLWKLIAIARNLVPAPSPGPTQPCLHVGVCPHQPCHYLVGEAIHPPVP